MPDANLMRRGQQVLADKKKLAEAVTVKIERGPDIQQAVPARLGSQLLRTTTGDGEVKTQRTDLDFLILVSDYKVNNVVTEPANNDMILYDGKRYRVMPFGDVAARRDSSAGFGISWRIHTRRSGNE